MVDSTSTPFQRFRRLQIIRIIATGHAAHFVDKSDNFLRTRLAKVDLIQTLLCGFTKMWDGLHQVYTMDIGIPIVDIISLNDCNGCGDDYEPFQIDNIDVLRGRAFANGNFKILKRNCPYHFSQHCALDNATLLRDHFYQTVYL